MYYSAILNAHMLAFILYEKLLWFPFIRQVAKLGQLGNITISIVTLATVEVLISLIDILLTFLMQNL